MSEYEAWQTALLVAGYVLVLVLGAWMYWRTSENYQVRQEQKRLGYSVPTVLSHLRCCCVCCLGPLARKKWERENLVWRSTDYGDKNEQWETLFRMSESERRALAKNPHCKWAQLPRGDVTSTHAKMAKDAFRRIRAIVIQEMIEDAIDSGLAMLDRDALNNRAEKHKAECIRQYANQWRGKATSNQYNPVVDIDFADDSSDEDDWDLGMSNQVPGESLDFLNFIPATRRRRSSGVLIDRIPKKQQNVQPIQDAWNGATAWGTDVVAIKKPDEGASHGQHQHARVQPKIMQRGFPNPVVATYPPSKRMPIGPMKTVATTMTTTSAQNEYNSIDMNEPLPLTDRRLLPLIADPRHIAFSNNQVVLPPLSRNPTVQEQYINASYIRGPELEKNKYIITQIPLAGTEEGKISTVDHFWRMIWLNKTNTVLVVEDGPQFWPRPHRGYLIGNLHVVLKDHVQRHDFDVVLVKMTESTRSINVQLYIFNRWAFGESPEPGPLFSMLHEVASYTKHNQGGPIAITDRVGGDRAGIVVALECLIYQLETTSQVDIVSTVYNLRQDRGGLISDVTYYVALYKLIHMYSDATGLGSNASEYLTAAPGPIQQIHRRADPQGNLSKSQRPPPQYVHAPRDTDEDVGYELAGSRYYDDV